MGDSTSDAVVGSQLIVVAVELNRCKFVVRDVEMAVKRS
jgi:hypothetical protein